MKIIDENESLRFAIMLESLKDQGVSSIYVGFDGSGDSGEVEMPEFLDGTGTTVKGIISAREEDIATDIRNFVEAKLLDQVGDWWNNDGGYDHVNIEVPSGEYKIEAHIRHTETHDNDYEGRVQDYFEEEDD